MRRTATTSLLLAIITAVEGKEPNLSSTLLIEASAKSIANGLMHTYPTALSGADTGLFDTNYTWWEDAAVYGSLIDYWALTGDSEYNSQTQKAISAQVGANKNFLPGSQASIAGNADQSLWALTVLSAVEQKFPSATSDGYLDLAKSVFDQQVVRWDNWTCAGGLRARINPGAEKDAFSIGTFFQLAARLAQQTQNSTYTQWATRAYEWAANVGIVSPQTYAVYEGTDSETNCSAGSLQQTQWSANAGVFLYGSALMFNVTYTQTWATRTQGFFTSINSTFFQNGIVKEPSCTSSSCTLAQRAYKALLVRSLARTAMSAPFTTEPIQQLLSSSAKGIVSDCDDSGSCIIGGEKGLGEQMTALDSTLALLIGRSEEASANTTSLSPNPSATAKGSSGASRAGVDWVVLIVLSITVILAATAIP